MRISALSCLRGVQSLSLITFSVAAGLVGCGSDDPATTGATPSESAPPAGATGTIGPDGGNINSASSSITVPAGALPAATALEVRATSDAERANLAPAPTGFDILGTPHAFLPHGTTFASPVELTLAYDSAATGQMAVFRLDDEADPTWEPVANATFDAGVARFQVTSFSIYALAIETAPAGSGGSFGSGGSLGTGGEASGGASSGGASSGGANSGGANSGGASTGGAIGSGGATEPGSWDSEYLTIWAYSGLAGRADSRVQGGASQEMVKASTYGLEPLFDTLNCAGFSIPAASAPTGVAQLVVNLDHSEEAPDPDEYFVPGMAGMNINVQTYLDGAPQQANLLLLAVDGTTFCRAQPVAAGLSEPSVPMNSFTDDCTPGGTPYDGRSLYSVAYEFRAASQDEDFVLCFARASLTTP